MSLSPEELELVQQEESTFTSVIRSLRDQKEHAESKIRTESERARSLTSQIVAARTDEDKAMLASDEAVSHGLWEQKRILIDLLKKQLEKPYFARIILEEEESDGSIKKIEYKLGFHANPDCRIIDWRKAPISKLYYEYKEGDEYSEEILGREREGRVILRNRIEAAKGILTGITNRFGSYVWNAQEGSWENTSSGSRKQSDAQLPEILSLITAEQFRLITEDAQTAILIQGIAGSGKTTVAMHRLAWLLHEDNSELEEDECAVIVLSPALRTYIENSFPSVGITGVKVHTYHEWAARTLKWAANDEAFAITRPVTPCPSSIERVKRSMGLLRALERYISTQEDRSFRAQLSDLQNDLITVLSNPGWILEEDETKLLDASLIQAACERTRLNFRESFFDWADDALLMRLYELKVGSVRTEKGSLGKYRHIVVDEVQDLSPVELATIVGAVTSIDQVTLVGDADQNINAIGTFPGWSKLLKHWNFQEGSSKYVTLTVSHRSTLPIMRLAEHVQQKNTVTDGRPGRVPIWFKCRTEADGIQAALKWLAKALELYPNRLAAVICANQQEAKFAFRMLQPTFGPTVRLGDQNSFSFEEGILVTDIRQVKGLEFFSVLLWNPSAQDFPNTELGRNLLYVAITRTEENLAIVNWKKPSELLPRFGRSSLIRSVDLSQPEEEG